MKTSHPACALQPAVTLPTSPQSHNEESTQPGGLVPGHTQTAQVLPPAPPNAAVRT
jgi:hypothetical protein